MHNIRDGFHSIGHLNLASKHDRISVSRIIICMITNNVPRLPGNLPGTCACGEATINATMEGALLPTSSKDEQERPPLGGLAEGHLVKLDSFGREKFLCLCAERTSVPSEDSYLSHDGRLLVSGPHSIVLQF